MILYKQKQYSEDSREAFINYLNNLEAWKTRCKNLHWAAEHKNIHEYLDEYYNILVDYQDKIAETYMGITEKLHPLDINPTACDKITAIDLIEDVINITAVEFYQSIPDDVVFMGIRSEVESFMQETEKYKYLFGLCK
jgi:hypothetical protein